MSVEDTVKEKVEEAYKVWRVEECAKLLLRIEISIEELRGANKRLGDAREELVAFEKHNRDRFNRQEKGDYGHNGTSPYSKCLRTIGNVEEGKRY